MSSQGQTISLNDLCDVNEFYRLLKRGTLQDVNRFVSLIDNNNKFSEFIESATEYLRYDQGQIMFYVAVINRIRLISNVNFVFAPQANYVQDVDIIGRFYDNTETRLFSEYMKTKRDYIIPSIYTDNNVLSKYIPLFNDDTIDEYNRVTQLGYNIPNIHIYIATNPYGYAISNILDYSIYFGYVNIFIYLMITEPDLISDASVIFAILCKDVEKGNRMLRLIENDHRYIFEENAKRFFKTALISDNNDVARWLSLHYLDDHHISQNFEKKLVCLHNFTYDESILNRQNILYEIDDVELFKVLLTIATERIVENRRQRNQTTNAAMRTTIRNSFLMRYIDNYFNHTITNNVRLLTHNIAIYCIEELISVGRGHIVKNIILRNESNLYHISYAILDIVYNLISSDIQLTFNIVEYSTELMKYLYDNDRQVLETYIVNIFSLPVGYRNQIENITGNNILHNFKFSDNYAIIRQVARENNIQCAAIRELNNFNTRRQRQSGTN